MARLPVAGATRVGGLVFSPDGQLLRLRAEGSTSALGGVRFLRLGDPSALPGPEDGLRDVALCQAVIAAHRERRAQAQPTDILVAG